MRAREASDCAAAARAVGAKATSARLELVPTTGGPTIEAAASSIFGVWLETASKIFELIKNQKSAVACQQKVSGPGPTCRKIKSPPVEKIGLAIPVGFSGKIFRENFRNFLQIFL